MKPKTLLKKARRESGLSQRALAKAAGVPQSTVGRIESGAIDPRAGTLQRLLEACGWDLILEPRLGQGVDESQIRERLALSPRERIERATKAAQNLAQIRGRARSKR
jgi:predicted transcriptional regulator